MIDPKIFLAQVKTDKSLGKEMHITQNLHNIYFSKSDLFKFENFILDIINFDLHICSPYLFLTKFFYSNDKKENIQILYLAQLLLDILTLDLEFCSFKPSFQAVVCLYISKTFIYKNKGLCKVWSDENEFITN